MRLHRNFAICLVVGGLNGTRASAAENSSVSDAPSVVERAAGGGWTVKSTFDVPASPSIALDVLTDYAHMQQFVSGVIASTVLKSTPQSVLLDQRMLGRVLFFSREVHVILDIRRASAGALSFTDTAHQDFDSYRGSWTVVATRTGARVAYSLECRPRMAIPGFIGGAALQSGTVNLITQVRAEIIHRALGELAAIKPGATHAHE